MGIFIIIIVLGLIIYTVSQDKKNNTQNIVTNYGGMLNKYSELVNYFKQNGCKITKVNSNTIILETSSMTWCFDIVGDNLEIRMRGFMPMLGNVSNKWIYPHNFSQTRIIMDIENYATWQMEQVVAALENNSKKHLQ